MKKLILLPALLLLVTTFSYGQTPNQKNLPEFFKILYEDSEYIFGNVKEIHYCTYDAVEQNGKIVLAGKLVTNNLNHQTYSYYFNPSGQIIQCNAINLAGNWIGIFNYENDKLANVYWLINDTLKYNWIYTYPNAGKLVRTILNPQNDNITNTTYLNVDNNGLIMNQMTKNNKGEQVGNSIVYERDADGTITNKKEIAPDGKIFNHFDVWNYDENGKKYKIHRTVFQGEKVDFYGPTHTYEYDDKGNWIKRTSIFPNNNIRVTVRKFVYD